MSVRTLCLAILNFGDATGYEIRKLSTEGKYSYFVDASFGSIYPALARLEAEGLVTVREEAQSGKPSRKVYSITEAGRAEFIRDLSQPPGPDIYRSPFLLVAMCAELVGPEVIGKAIDARLEQMHTELAKLEAIAGEPCDHRPASRFILEYGRSCMTEDIRFLEANRHRLEDIARGLPALPQAAE